MRDPGASALLTDLYQLSMLQTYFERGMTQTAVFELFFRRLPKSRNFLVAAGLEQALEFLENLAFAPDELEWLSAQGFPPAFVDQLASLRFAGDVQAVPEGTLLFPDEPIIRVVAPLPQAQLVETRLMNILHFQTLIASKAARARPCCNWSCVAAAASRPAPPCSTRASAASASWSCCRSRCACSTLRRLIRYGCRTACVSWRWKWTAGRQRRRGNSPG